MESKELELWLDRDRQHQILDRLVERLGLTRARGECFLRLWIYLLVKEQRERNPQIKPPLLKLTLLDRPAIFVPKGYANAIGGAIDRDYLDLYRVRFLEDTQKTLVKMQEDFPNLCDLYTIIIHPMYEYQASALGFQNMSRDRQLSIYWMYLPLDRFLALNIADCFPIRA